MCIRDSTYTDCSNQSHTWTYTYTITRPDFTLPADGSSTCLFYTSDAADERSSVDLGGRRIIKKVVVSPSPVTCNGTMAYTFTYTDCSNQSHTWTYTYTITRPDFTLPADGSSTVNCPVDAVLPTAPIVVDACGNTLSPVVVSPSPVTCNGTMAYTFTYTDCSNQSHTWTYTYTITRPDFTLPADGSGTVRCPVDAVRRTGQIFVGECGNTLSPVVV